MKYIVTERQYKMLSELESQIIDEFNNGPYYRFQNSPSSVWGDDKGMMHPDDIFNGKNYQDYYFSNFYDMDKQFGHKNSLFGTKGLPVGHPNRSSRSFDIYNKIYGPMIVRIIEQ